MDCNRDDAIRSKEIAESKFKENDIAGAKKFALKAKALFEPLEGIDQMILALDVHLRAQTKIGAETDWYGILEVATLDDEETIRKQYKKLAFQTHPDKNSFIGADGAFKLISDAWNVLSDKNKRILHDQKRYMGSLGVHKTNSQVNVDSTSSSTMPSMNGFCSKNSGPAWPTNVPPYNVPKPSTFWTSCYSCSMSFQYPREYFHQYLKCPVCQKLFLAVEVAPPPTPIYPNEPKPVDTNTSMGGTSVPDGAMPGTGVASGSQNYDPMLRRWSFLGFAAGAHTSINPMQQIHQAVSGSSLGSSDSTTKTLPQKSAATKEKEAAKRSYKKVKLQSASSVLGGDSGSQIQSAKRKPGSSTRTSGTKRRKVPSGDLNCESSGTSFGKVIKQLDVRSMLINKMKLHLQEKLEDFNRKKANVENKEKMQASKKRSKKVACSPAVDYKETQRKQSSNSVYAGEDDGKELAGKRVVSEEQERVPSSKHAGLEAMKSWEWRKPEIHFVYMRRNRKEQKPSSDEGSHEMPVPDADFCNFGDHSESSFQKDQVWATYDEEDGMPRYYALVRKVLSTHPFKARLAFLKADDCNEFGTSNWISCGYSKTCGDFKPGPSKYIDQLNTFSHVVTWEKGPGGTIRIFPKKGDIWALYQNWSPDWDEFTPDQTMYKYELVEVLDHYNPMEGISVMPIVKIPGFVSVFKPLHDPMKSRKIPKAEMLRFSHQVPFYVLTGEEAQNSPKGCYELDPGSTPKELLQVFPQSNDAK